MLDEHAIASEALEAPRRLVTAANGFVAKRQYSDALTHYYDALEVGRIPKGLAPPPPWPRRRKAAVAPAPSARRAQTPPPFLGPFVVPGWLSLRPAGACWGLLGPLQVYDALAEQRMGEGMQRDLMRDMAKTLNNLAAVLHQLRKFDEAISVYGAGLGAACPHVAQRCCLIILR